MNDIIAEIIEKKKQDVAIKGYSLGVAIPEKECTP